jgi:hypothetical protein
MIKKILNKNISDLVRIPEFLCFIALQLILLLLAIFNQLPHVLSGYIFKFDAIVLYFLAAYISAKFIFNIRKTNGFAFIFMKPIHKSVFALLSIISIALTMVIPLLILLLSIITANYHMESDLKLSADIDLNYDKSSIRKQVILIKHQKEDLSFDQIYKELIINRSTISPGQKGRWNFAVPENLQEKDFIIVYNKFFNIINQFNTNSYWKIYVDDRVVFTDKYKYDGLPTDIVEPVIEQKLSDRITVEFINKSSDIPIMFVPGNPVKLVFGSEFVILNLFKGAVKTFLNILLVISICFVLSIFMSIPGTFFTSYLSIISCLLYKFFYLNNKSAMIMHITFGNGLNEALNSKYIYLNQLVLFGFMVLVFIFLMVKIAEFQFKSNSFYIENR